MYFENVLRLVLVSSSYIILIFGLGSLMMKPLAKKRDMSERFLIYFISGNFYIINIVYLLLFFKQNSRLITILTLLIGALGIRLLFDSKGFVNDIANRVEKVALLARGVYGWRSLTKTALNKIGNRFKYICKQLFTKYLFETIMILGCFAVQAFYIGYRYVNYASFAASDEPVHLKWIQEMVINGNLYNEGEIYPYGLHNIVYAISKVFGFKAYTAYRYFGFIVTMFLLVMLFLLIKKIFRSRFAPYVGVFLYVAAEIFNETAWDRLMYCVPMEFGILFLYPLAIFLYNYICRQDKLDLIFFCICFSLSLYVHGYDGIMALILCISIGIAFFIRMLNNKVLVKILLFGFLSGAVGLLPIGIGLMTGHELQGSFTWASNVIQGTAEKINIDSVLDDENRTGTDNNSVEGANQEGDNQDNTSTKAQDGDNLIVGKTKNPMVTIYNHTVLYLMKDNNATLFILLLIAMLLTIIRAVAHFIRKSINDELYLQLGITIYVLILLVMLCSEQLGLPIIIEDYRISEYLAYAFPLLLGLPLEYIYLLLSNRKPLKILVNSGIVLLTACTVFSVYYYGHARHLGRYTIVNTDSAARAYYKIINQFQDYQWTIVSTVNEYSIVLDTGRHGDWLTFLTQLSNYSPTMRIEFPTQDVFFFVEKRPIIQYDIVYLDNMKQYPEFTEKDAMMNIGHFFYTNRSDFYIYNRNQIMAKAYYWAEKYMYYFPNEMSIFYEDDEFICYHLEQEPEYLNNLAIDYGYN